MRMRLVVLLGLCWVAVSVRGEFPAAWTKAVEPVRVVGNIYYVGTEDLGSYLVATDKGLVLLDVPMAENVPLIVKNIEKLGFDPKKIRVLIASHAHMDHIGGFAAMKEKTGATVYLSAPDAELAARGGLNDFAFGDTLAYPAVKADRIVKDGDVVRLGGAAMTAMVTPGHTRGCTTWRTTVKENGKPLDVVFLCSVTAPGYTLVNNTKYPKIMDDYRATFARLRKLEPDVFLSNHGSFFGLTGKLARVKDGGPNPFVGQGEWRPYLDRAWKDLESAERKQRGE